MSACGTSAHVLWQGARPLSQEQGQHLPRPLPDHSTLLSGHSTEASAAPAAWSGGTGGQAHEHRHASPCAAPAAGERRRAHWRSGEQHESMAHNPSTLCPRPLLHLIPPPPLRLQKQAPPQTAVRSPRLRCTRSWRASMDALGAGRRQAAPAPRTAHTHVHAHAHAPTHVHMHTHRQQRRASSVVGEHGLPGRGHQGGHQAQQQQGGAGQARHAPAAYGGRCRGGRGGSLWELIVQGPCCKYSVHVSCGLGVGQEQRALRGQGKGSTSPTL